MILLFGGSGLLGRALQDLLKASDIPHVAPSHQAVDCRDPQQVRDCVRTHRPSVMISAAARVGGIAANLRCQEEFLYDNAMINLTSLQVATEERVPKVLVFGSSCMYPKGIDRPIREEDLLTGSLEPTSEGYALAKILATQYAQILNRSGRCQAMVCVPTNLYGNHDHFDAEEGHLIAALLVKMHQAKEAGHRQLKLWGDGTPRRDFLHVSDLARACLRILEAPDPPSVINVGSGRDTPVREIAHQVANVVEFDGEILFAGGIPSGTARKLLNIERILALGWKPRIPLEVGLEQVYLFYRSRLREPVESRSFSS